MLANNAGALFASRKVTSEGFEETFALNHLAPFLLTNLIRERLGGGRVVTTASDAHRSGRLDLDDLQSERSYAAMRAYSTSKLCNILFTRELARRAPELHANCFHPGDVRTGFGKNENGIWKVLTTLGGPFMRSPERGARSLVWLALAPEAGDLDGEYVEDERVVSPSPQAQDDELARRLWERSTELVGLPGRRTRVRHAADLRAIIRSVVPKASLESADGGLAPSGPGWFVLNVSDARWLDGQFGAYTRFEGQERFPKLGFNIGVLEPGQPACMYHGEDEQEDFLVLSGECLLLIEGTEQRLRHGTSCTARHGPSTYSSARETAPARSSRWGRARAAGSSIRPLSSRSATEPGSSARPTIPCRPTRTSRTTSRRATARLAAGLSAAAGLPRPRRRSEATAPARLRGGRRSQATAVRALVVRTVAGDCGWRGTRPPRSSRCCSRGAQRGRGRAALE